MSEPSNIERAACGEQALLGYSSAKEGGPALYDVAGDVFTDMLTDLMHFAHRSGFNFASHLRLAEMHFDAEIGEEGDQP